MAVNKTLRVLSSIFHLVFTFINSSLIGFSKLRPQSVKKKKKITLKKLKVNMKIPQFLFFFLLVDCAVI